MWLRFFTMHEQSMNNQKCHKLSDLGGTCYDEKYDVDVRLRWKFKWHRVAHRTLQPGTKIAFNTLSKQNYLVMLNFFLYIEKCDVGYYNFFSWLPIRFLKYPFTFSKSSDEEFDTVEQNSKFSEEKLCSIFLLLRMYDCQLSLPIHTCPFPLNLNEVGIE